MISVRIAAAADFTLVAEIRERSFASVRDIYRPVPDCVVRPESFQGNRIDVIARIDDTSVGVVGIYSEEETLRFVGLGVLPNYRQRGVGRCLVESGEHIARQRGHASIALSTIAETGNPKWFQQLGFSVTATHVAKWCVGPRNETLHEVEMQRCLSPQTS